MKIKVRRNRSLSLFIPEMDLSKYALKRTILLVKPTEFRRAKSKLKLVQTMGSLSLRRKLPNSMNKLLF